MIELKDIERLAYLSRIEMSEEEMKGFVKDFESILGYVAQIQEAITTEQSPTIVGPLRNVMREDGEPHVAGAHTKEIMEEAPLTKGAYLQVKKIL